MNKKLAYAALLFLPFSFRAEAIGGDCTFRLPKIQEVFVDLDAELIQVIGTCLIDPRHLTPVVTLGNEGELTIDFAQEDQVIALLPDVPDGDYNLTLKRGPLTKTDHDLTIVRSSADSDSTDELQSLSRNDTSITLSSGGGTVSIADNDNDSSNELNTSLVLNGSTLELTDAGGTLSAELGTSSGVTSIDTGAGLTGGPITSSGIISIATGGVTNTMLANSSVAVNAGLGLAGGGQAALGDGVSLSNTGIVTINTRSAQGGASAGNFNIVGANGLITTSQTGQVTLSHDAGIFGGVNNTGGTVVQDIILDGRGHLAGVNSINLDSRYVSTSGDTIGGTLSLNDLDFVRGDTGRIRSLGSISFDWTAGTYDDPLLHGMSSTSEAGVPSDNLSFNSFNDIINTIDTNNNNSVSHFVIEHHSTGNGQDLFWVQSPNGNAFFLGSVSVNGDLSVAGNVSKGGGSFKIDHPLDPENKYLYHSFIESPDMKNVYDGVVTLDESGEAWVKLPPYFEALNRDLRYQLTCIGGHAPVFVAQEVKDNRFLIAGGTPELKVSWQVTGIRQDKFAKANPIVAEVAKAEWERGHYLHPLAHGQPEEKSIQNAKSRRMLSRAED